MSKAHRRHTLQSPFLESADQLWDFARESMYFSLGRPMEYREGDFRLPPVAQNARSSLVHRLRVLCEEGRESGFTDIASKLEILRDMISKSDIGIRKERIAIRARFIELRFY